MPTYWLMPTYCWGQTAQLPSTAYPNPWNPSVPAATGTFPPGGYSVPNSGTPTYPAGTPFDPYAPGFRPSTAPVPTYPTWNWNNLFTFAQTPQANPYGQIPTYPTYPTGVPSTYSNPYAGQPVMPTGAGPNPYGQPVYPTNAYPNSTPNVLFPGTGASAPLNSQWNYQNQPNPYGYPSYPGYPPTTNWSSWWDTTGNNINYGTNQVIRLFQGPRFRHTWLPGSEGFDSPGPNSLQSNDTDVSLVFAIPSFFGSTRPLYLIPSYTQTLWDGPTSPDFAMPSSAFAGFLDTGWETDPMKTFGVELGLRVGVFADFDAVNSDSVRFQGKAMGRLRLTPTATGRAGVFYLDRNKIKLLPAFGILWAPNQDTRFDIFFPEPKLAHYLSTVGNSDMWWYLTGYYGGGNWTIRQPDGTNDQVDINDIRIMMGLEFGRSDQIRQGLRVGFIEGGYAFNRELSYRVLPIGDVELENSFVLRAGFAY
jgi:hypothetical protein